MSLWAVKKRFPPPRFPSVGQRILRILLIARKPRLRPEHIMDRALSRGLWFDRPPRLRLPAFQSCPHKRTLHQHWMFSHGSLVPDSLRGVNTFCVLFVLTPHTTSATLSQMAKPKTISLSIRALPETVATIHKLAAERRIGVGAALDLLVKRAGRKLLTGTELATP